VLCGVDGFVWFQLKFGTTDAFVMSAAALMLCLLLRDRLERVVVMLRCPWRGWWERGFTRGCCVIRDAFFIHIVFSHRSRWR